MKSQAHVATPTGTGLVVDAMTAPQRHPAVGVVYVTSSVAPAPMVADMESADGNGHCPILLSTQQ